MKKLYFSGSFLQSAIIAVALLFLPAACASGGGDDVDGDIEVIEQETCDIKCDPGCYIVDCECKCFGDEDGDIDGTDAVDNGDGDTDSAENDGDQTDNVEDSDIDDSEIDEDGDMQLPDYDVDPDQEEPCSCDPEDPFSCSEGFYCDGCYCQPESTDGDQTDPDTDYEGILCDNGLPQCYGFDSENDVDMNIGHEACPADAACDVEDGCCTRDEIVCSNPIGCPGHWHCNTGVNVCDYECLSDEDCQKKYKSASWSCSDDGWCVVVDGDEEEEGPEPCNGCEDCDEQHPEGGYFCSSVTGYCEAQPPEDGCCNDDDCEVVGFACDPADGACKWNGSAEDIGRISGTLTTSVDFAGFTYIVKCYDETATLEAQSGNIVPQYANGEYIVNYNLFQLSEGEKDVKISAIHLPGQESPFHANPVDINYLSQDTTYRTDINFYVGVPNPMLGSVGGTVRLNSAYDDDFIEVELLKMEPSGWKVYKTAELFPEDQEDNLRYFAFTNLNPGSTHTTASYYLRANIYHGDGIEYDYKPNAYVVNLANPSQLHYDNEKLYAGYEDTSLGSVVGSVHYPEFYSDSSFPRDVKLYADYQFKYEVGVARISNLSTESFDYEILNLEPKTYWIRYESEVYGYAVRALPGPSETVITLELRQKDFDVDIYMDVPQPWVGSVSGEISFTQAQISEGMFYVQAYYNNTFTAPVSDTPDLVLRYDLENDTAQYFIDQLDTGNYYIKAWLESPEGAILDEEIWGGEATPTAVPVNAESSTPGLKDVGGIDLDFTTVK